MGAKSYVDNLNKMAEERQQKLTENDKTLKKIETSVIKTLREARSEIEIPVKPL